MIAVFGGAFNPPTVAHFEVAKYVLAMPEVTGLLFVPVGDRYEKADLVPAGHRVRMLEIVAEGLPGARVSQVEIEALRALKTIETLERLQLEYPDSELAFVMGADNLASLTKWYQYERLIKNFKLIILQRGECDVPAFIEEHFSSLSDQFLVAHDFEKLDVSSTAYRTALGGTDLLLPGVATYVENNELYGRLGVTKVLAIVGPTAVGKTRLSVELAAALDGEIISGDAMQIYRGMDIGTAKITAAEMAGVPHHLLDEKEPGDAYSVAEFQKAVRAKIDEITARGKLPIIVGGTGLYVKAVLYDYEFSDEARPSGEQYEALTNAEVHAKLAEVDPVSARDLHPNNRRRVVRALNIYTETSKTKSETIDAQEKKLLYDTTLIGLTDDRPALYERINARVDAMMAGGLVEEVRALHAAGVPRDSQSIQAIGYKEIYDYLDGLVELETAVELVKRNSRRLAKRQYTWFRNQMDVTWFDVDVANFEQTVAAVLQHLQE